MAVSTGESLRLPTLAGCWAPILGGLATFATADDLVRKYGSAWIMTGPLYEAPMPPLPNCDEPHKVPSGFWKIVAVQGGASLHIASFIMEQGATRKSSGIDYLTTVDEVERRSGLDFFWQLPDTEEDALEAAKDLAWAQSWVN
jgi:endonuclease G